jgi:hypothetical protein
MSEIKSEQGYPSQLVNWFARRNFLRRPLISTGQRAGYALVSFLMGVTYLKVLTVLNFQFSLIMLLFSLLGGLCFAVCIYNLIAIFAETR